MSQEFFAAIHNNDRTQVEQFLASEPALARARNQNGASALMQARYEGRHELVELLRSKAGELDVFEATMLGDLPRLRALLAGNPALAKAFSADGFTSLVNEAVSMNGSGRYRRIHRANASGILRDSTPNTSDFWG